MLGIRKESKVYNPVLLLRLGRVFESRLLGPFYHLLLFVDLCVFPSERMKVIFVGTCLGTGPKKRRLLYHGYD